MHPRFWIFDAGVLVIGWIVRKEKVVVCHGSVLEHGLNSCAIKESVCVIVPGDQTYQTEMFKETLTSEFPVPAPVPEERRDLNEWG